MKNSFNLGDWVYEPSTNHYLQLGTKGVFSICEDSLNVEPISLTVDILKANGFIADGEDLEYILYLPFTKEDIKKGILFRSYIDCIVMNDGHICTDIEYNYAKNRCNKVQIHTMHVHEFQHALRLCGLNELADNLKLK